MSNLYGPSFPSGPPDPYGSSRPQGPSDPYGAASPSGFQNPQPPYAPWGARFGAYLLDMVFYTLSWGVSLIGFVMSFSELRLDETAPADEWPFYWVNGSPPGAALTVMLAGLAVPLLFWLYNWPIRQGRTGSTLGKSIVGIAVVSEYSGKPLGIGWAWVREIAHWLDSAVLIGYLWPLWDPKRQTFADKVMTSIVVYRDPWFSSGPGRDAGASLNEVPFTHQQYPPHR